MNKYKIIGITEINIPSIDHKEVPYYILLLENENGRYSIKKSFKEYAVGEYIDPSIEFTEFRDLEKN